MNDRLQQNLADARYALLEAQDWLYYVRFTNALGYINDAIKRRHRAADRVWDLQCMANGVFQ